MKEREFYDVFEVAEKLGITKVTVRTWLKDGKLRGKKVGRSWRINKKSVHAILPTDDQTTPD